MKHIDSERLLWGTMIDTKRFILENSTCTDKVQLQKSMKDFIRGYRSRIQRINSHQVDPLEKPLSEALRIHWNPDGDSYTEYGVLPEIGYTSDDEIRDYIRENIWIDSPHSMYDCTGRFFSWDVSWNRVPAGIAIVHRVSLDI